MRFRVRCHTCDEQTYVDVQTRIDASRAAGPFIDDHRAHDVGPRDVVDRWRRCLRKFRYPGRQSVEREIARRHNAAQLVSYPCPWCDGWHLAGHQTRGARRLQLAVARHGDRCVFCREAEPKVAHRQPGGRVPACWPCVQERLPAREGAS